MRSGRTSSRARTLWGVAIAGSALAIVIAGGAAWAHRVDHGPADRRPVVLPETLGDRPISVGDFGTDASWTDMMHGWVDDDHAFGGRAYARPLQHNSGGALNVTVIRGRYVESGDIRLAAAPFTQIGQVTCTKTIDMRRAQDAEGVKVTGPTYNGSWQLCWRTSRTLTVSVWALAAPSETAEHIAAMVEDIWALQG